MTKCYIFDIDLFANIEIINYRHYLILFYIITDCFIYYYLISDFSDEETKIRLLWII